MVKCFVLFFFLGPKCNRSEQFKVLYKMMHSRTNKQQEGFNSLITLEMENIE